MHVPTTARSAVEAAAASGVSMLTYPANTDGIAVSRIAGSAYPAQAGVQPAPKSFDGPTAVTDHTVEAVLHAVHGHMA